MVMSPAGLGPEMTALRFVPHVVILVKLLNTDGAHAVTDRCSGVASRVKSVSPEAKLIHCCIHWELLAMKKFPVS
jgi:hypothetical protein